MDPSRDNPILRFTTFFWGIGTFLIFAVLLVAIWVFFRADPATLEDEAAKPRYVTRDKIKAAQAANLPPETLEQAILKASADLAVSKPVAIEKPEQLVPGSPTALKMADAPKVDISAVDALSAEIDAPIDPAVMELGQAQFLVCGACHGQNGEGGPIAPPLAGAEWVTGPISNLILIQLRGLQGAITVKGVEYNMPGGMAPMAYQTDEQIAAVLTYIRNSFGNKASAVKPEQVKALRGEVGKPQITAAELIQP